MKTFWIHFKATTQTDLAIKMKPVSRRLVVALYTTPVLGDLLTGCLYLWAKAITFLVVWQSGGIRLKYGRSVIATPMPQSRAIQDGADRLSRCDPAMFLRFSRQGLNIAYSNQSGRLTDGGLFFNLHQRYLDLGAEGVAVFLVQCTLLSEASPSINRCRIPPHEIAAMKHVLRNVLMWMRQQSFHPALIHSYKKVVEKWESSRRFDKL